MDQRLNNPVNEWMNKQMKVIVVFMCLSSSGATWEKLLIKLYLRLLSCNSGMNDLLFIKPYEILGEKSYINVIYYFIHCDFWNNLKDS